MTAPVLYPASLARRRPPANLTDADRAVFAHELERAIPPTILRERRDVWASSDGILFKRARILPESFAFPSLHDGWKPRSRMKFLAVNYALKRHRALRGDALWVVDTWSYGYFHWLADALPRLFAVRDRAPELTLLLPERYATLEFVRASLAPFRLGGVDFIGAGEAVLCRRLLLPSHTAPSGHYNPDIINGLRALLIGGASAPRDATDALIYVSRAQAGKRRIANETDVVETLGGLGFRTVRTEGLPFAEQVRLFSGARHLVANHGAGLTNMLFMPPDGRVLELRHANDPASNCYFTLSSALGLTYFYQSCAPAKDDEDPHTADLVVDTQRLRANVAAMLAGAPANPA